MVTGSSFPAAIVSREFLQGSGWHISPTPRQAWCASRIQRTSNPPWTSSWQCRPEQDLTLPSRFQDACTRASNAMSAWAVPSGGARCAPLTARAPAPRGSPSQPLTTTKTYQRPSTGTYDSVSKKGPAYGRCSLTRSSQSLTGLRATPFRNASTRGSSSASPNFVSP